MTRLMRNQLCKLKANGAPFAIAEATDTHVTVQGWAHRQTFTLAEFEECFELVTGADGSYFEGDTEER